MKKYINCFPSLCVDVSVVLNNRTHLCRKCNISNLSCNIFKPFQSVNQLLTLQCSIDWSVNLILKSKINKLVRFDWSTEWKPIWRTHFISFLENYRRTSECKMCWINLCQWLSCSTGLGTNINHCPNKPQNTYFYPFVLKQEKQTSSLCQMLSSGTTRSSTIDSKQILKLNSNWNPLCVDVTVILCDFLSLHSPYLWAPGYMG